MISNPLTVFFVLAGIVFVALQLEARYKLFRSLGAALVGILLGMLLSNLNVLPGASEAYAFLVGPGVSAGIVLILLSVDLTSIRKAGPVMLKAFALGAVGTALGAMIMGFLLSSSIGPETWKLAGQYAGTYTGGGLNFAAVGQAVGTSSDLFTAGIAADVIVTALWLSVCLAAPLFLGGGKNEQPQAPETENSELGEQPFTLERLLYISKNQIPIVHVAAFAALVLGCLWLADVLATNFSFLPKILWLTTVTLLVAQLPAIKRLSGGAMLGNYLILLFLASNGAQSVVANIVKMGPSVFYFAFGVVTIHGIFLFGVGRLLRIDASVLVVASQANVGGPASAMAIASARRYSDSLLPGVAVGLLGYAAGNYLGLAVASLMQNALG